MAKVYEQFKGMFLELNQVFIVCQTQPDCEIEGVPIAVYSDEKLARKLARKLNKVYGAECDFTRLGDFCSVNGCYDCCHYYTVERTTINPKIENFL